MNKVLTRFFSPSNEEKMLVLNILIKIRELKKKQQHF